MRRFLSAQTIRCWCERSTPIYPTARSGASWSAETMGWKTVSKTDCVLAGSDVIECGTSVTKFSAGDVIFVGASYGHVEYRLVKESDLVVKLPDGFDLEAGALIGVA